MALDDAAARAAKAILERPARRWFLDCDTDADGLCAAAVIAQALARSGQRFQVRASRDKTTAGYVALAAQECDGYILLDKGSSHAAELAALSKTTGRPVVIIDHHNAEPEAGVFLVNPRLEGMDGSRDASAATTAVAVALAMDTDNLDLAAIGLSGAIGDWQHDGGWQGWNAELVERSQTAGHIHARRVPALIGASLPDAVAREADMTVAGAADWLQQLAIPDSDAEGLDVEASTRLVSALTLRQLAAGQPAKNWTTEVLQNHRLQLGLRQVFRMVDACGRLGHTGDGLAFLFGSAAGRAAAEAHFSAYRETLNAALADLRATGAVGLGCLQHARTNDPALTGMVAGIAMMHEVEGDRPLVVAAPRPDGRVQVSTRGSHEQVEAGMDLGAAIAAAAAAVGAEGGGHPIASGAVIAAPDYDAFLLALDGALKKQGFLGDA